MEIECLPNIATYDAWNKCEKHLLLHNKIIVSLSGGADSDIMLDFIQKVIKEKSFDYNCEIHYVFFNTGIEYDATKRHLDELEKKYSIVIERVKSKKPVPIACKEYGYPFLSKDISAKINSLQNNNFDFRNDGNKNYEELAKKYPKIKSTIQWWCNTKKSFNIQQNLYLKEFMIENPPDFRISQRCCEFSKKTPSKLYEKENGIDLKVLGLRKAEGGVRATSNHSCFTEGDNLHIDTYRPLWWFSDQDKAQYKKYFNIVFSDCYEVWGFERTGCAGCPFNSNFENDLITLQKYEPKLYNAVNAIFGKSYDYTRKYREFKEKMKRRGQYTIFDYIGEEV